jgi:hypothetical protein
MRRKLLLFNLAMILLVVFILALSGVYVYRQNLMKSRMSYITELQRQLAASFDLKIKSVENTLDILANTREIKDCLMYDGENPALKIEDEQAVRLLFSNYEKVNSDYLNMILVFGNGKEYISNDTYRLVNESFFKEQWFKEAVKNDYSYQFYNALRNLESWKKYDDGSYISIAKSVQDNHKSIGVIMIDVSLEEFKKLYRDIEEDTGSFFFLMNDEGKIILSPVNNIVYRVNSTWFSEKEGIIVSNILGKKYKFVYNKFRDENLLIVGAYDMEKENVILIHILEISLIMALSAFFIAMIWSVYFVSALTTPLLTLSELMKQASEGNFDVRFNEECDGDIQVLGKSFNKMASKLKDFLEMIYTEQKEKREAELQVMQEQIKPHFLYNTLDMMSWMARKHEALDIVNVIARLSDFFRISLSKGKEQIPLGEELKMVSSYLDIQSLRYQDLFVYDIDCPKYLESRYILRMSLQPLVENCLYHGIKEADNEESLLQIVIREIDGGISIMIKDNGKGMDDTVMEKLNFCLQNNNWDGWNGGFGVKNVGNRIWHSFKKGSGLYYSKDEEGFTVANLRILYPDE